MKEKYAKYVSHSGGRFQQKRFKKAQCPIVERLTNSLMMHGRNNGKKLLAVRIVKHSFEIIHLLTGEVRTIIRFALNYYYGHGMLCFGSFSLYHCIPFATLKVQMNCRFWCQDFTKSLRGIVNIKLRRKHYYFTNGK